MIRSVVPEDKEPYIAMTEAFYRIGCGPAQHSSGAYPKDF